MLDVRDWRPDLGGLGKLHIRFGNAARGPKARLIPAIDGADELIHWWLADIGISSARTGPIPTPRCCRASGTTGSRPGAGEGGPPYQCQPPSAHRSKGCGAGAVEVSTEPEHRAPGETRNGRSP
jgi:hypothetical protein